MVASWLTRWYGGELLTDELRRARYDFVQPESIDTFMNCTVDNDGSTVLETVTLPFVVSQT